MLSTPAIPSIDKNKLREVLITVSGALAGTAIALGSLVLALYLTDRPAGRGSLAVASSLISLAFIVVGAHLYATAKSLRRTPGRPLWGELITPPIYFLTAILIASVTPWVLIDTAMARLPSSWFAPTSAALIVAVPLASYGIIWSGRNAALAYRNRRPLVIPHAHSKQR